jgi:hypothetical protein
MKITDLFNQDILNPKPIIKENAGALDGTNTKLNLEAILLTLLFGFTIVVLTLKTKRYGTTRKEN